MRWDWELFKIWLEEVWSRWWWLYILIGVATPFLMMWLGFDMSHSTDAECVRYSSFAETC